MSEPRDAGPGSGPAPHDPELREFASRPLLTPADPEFRDTLRSELWELLLALVNRLRGR